MKKSKIFLNLITYYKKLSIPAKAGIYFLLCNFIVKGIVALTTPIFTRILSTEEYGQVSIFYSWQDILAIITTYGLSSSVYQRGLVKYEKQQDDFTGIMLTLSLVTTLLSFLLYYFFRRTINKVTGLSTFMMILLFIYSFVVTSIDFWYQKKRVMYQYVPFIIVTLLLALVKPVSSILAIFFTSGNKVMARILSDTIVSIFVGIPLIIIMVRRSKRYLDIKIWGESMRFVLPLIPHFLAQRILSQSDRIMISNIHGDSQAGIYSLAYSIGMLLMLLNNALGGTIEPWIYRNLREEHYDRIISLVQTLLLFFGTCVLSFVLITPEIVSIFAAPEYYEAIYIVPPVAVSSYFIYLYTQFIYFEYHIGKTQFVAIATLISAMLNLLLNFICIHKFGYIAAAYTTLVCYILYAVGHYVVMRYLCKRYLNVGRVFHVKFLFILSVGIIAVGIFVIPLYEFAFLRRVIAGAFILFTLFLALRIVKQFGTKQKDFW